MKTLNQYIAESPTEFRQEELILEATELVSRVMNQNNVSKTELASRLGKSKAYVTQCLSGEQNLTLRTLADLFTAVGYRMQVGAIPVHHGAKTVPHLYPIGGWSFEKTKSKPTPCVIDCAASELEAVADFEGAAA